MARRKRCPQCAEKVQAHAKICRYCGHSFEEVPAADPQVDGQHDDEKRVPALPLEQESSEQPAPVYMSLLPRGARADGARDAAHPPPEPADEEILHPPRPVSPKGKVRADRAGQWWRWVILVLYVLLAGSGLTSLTVADDGWGMVIVGGVVNSLVLLAFIGLFFWLFRRYVLRDRSVSYGQTLLSVPLIVICLFLAVSSAAGRAVREDEETDSAAASANTAAVEQDHRERALRQGFDRWFAEALKTGDDRDRAIDALETAIKSNATVDKVAPLYTTALRRARVYRDVIADLPGYSAELTEVNDGLARSANTLIASVAAFRAGYLQESDAKWERAQRLVRRSDRQATDALRDGHAYFQSLGGTAAFGPDYPIDKLELDE